MNIHSGQNPTHSLSFVDLSKMSGLPITSVTNAVQIKDLKKMDYIALTELALDKVEQRIKIVLNGDTLNKAGTNTIDRWCLGWQEILEDVRLNGVKRDHSRPNILNTMYCVSMVIIYGQ